MSVAKKSRCRGMSMGARMLLFSSLFLLALPWLGYRYIDEMKNFLLQGQEDAQLLAARAVAVVLNGRVELFHSIGEPADIAIEKSALYVYPLEVPVEVDGYSGDWGVLQQQAKNFARESYIYDRTGGSGQAVTFSLLLGEYRQNLYALIRVKDESIVYRNPKYRRLDHSDHVRLEILTPEGESKRIIFITEGQGQVSVYEMMPDWKTPETGKPVYAISGIWQERSDGYYLELRIPGSWVGAQPHLMFSVANVDSAVERQIDSIVATLEKVNAGKLNLLIKRSPQLDRILQGLGSADAGICVVDRYRRVRGVFGGENKSALCSQKDTVSPELVDKALKGSQSVLRYENIEGESVIVAAQPVYANDQVIGAVLVEKNSSHILGLQRESLHKIIIATFIVFLIAIAGLMLFAAWLAYRIRKLQKEASHAIDADGRVVSEHITADQYAADEIGQLSRNISSLLSRLKSYTGFLESVPRTLRHEILNPVNTISMSLQKLDDDMVNESILHSARKAAQQLEMIVHSLTEAAHIEDALKQDEYQRFDLAAMVDEYVNNSKLKHDECCFKYIGPGSGVYVSGSDLRIAQLLDKLKDNALDFSINKSEIVFELKQLKDKVELSVINHGSEIPEDVLGSLFAGMISSRPFEDDKPHLGIGLFIANRIAQQHQGELKIANLDNGGGVKVSLLLPAVV
jgi:two-component system, OmpR family, sensor histidine kinase ChvG